MLMDLRCCTQQQLNAALNMLNIHNDYVFWIRNDQMTKQIYISQSFQKIWGRKIDLMFDVPLIWFDYLNPDDKVQAMRQLDHRHIDHYLDHEKNCVRYQILNDKSEIVYIRDRSFRMKDHLGVQYIIGVSKTVTSQIWYPKNSKNNIEEEDYIIYEHFFALLKDNFGLIPVTQQQDYSKNIADLLKINLPSSDFSKREIECLFYLCKGQTYKQIARSMAISPRTVETHIERMRIKSDCSSKLQLIAKYSRFAPELTI